MREFSRLDQLEPISTELLEQHIFFGPSFAHLSVGGMDPDLYEGVRQKARELTFVHWRQTHPLWTDGPSASLELVEQILIEAISSTGAYLSHVEIGYLNVDEAMVGVASSLIDLFLDNHSVEDTISFGMLLHAYDDYLALAHYKAMKESDFVSGVLHRPWLHHTLQAELDWILGIGSVYRFSRDGESYLELTELGEARYRAMQGFLERTGSLKTRRTLARLSRFSQLEDYDEILNRIGGQALRKVLLEYSGITHGMNVLELGCGTGILTIDAGLCDLVGSSGSIAATDPASGMLSRARRKAEDGNIRNTSFRAAAAEQLPFEDNTFDAAIGFSFLHFTRMSDALREIHRVCKPGSFFTTFYPLHVPDSNPLFAEWFAPVLVSGASKGSSNDMLPGEDTVEKAIPEGLYTDVEILPAVSENDYGDPEAVVKFYIEVINTFESAMSTLPWKAQQDMVQTLIQRGKDIVATYGRDQLKVSRPVQFFKARVVHPNAP